MGVTPVGVIIKIYTTWGLDLWKSRGALVTANEGRMQLTSVPSSIVSRNEQYFSCRLNIHWPMLMKLGILLTIYEPYNLTKFRPNPSTGSRASVTVRLYGQPACMVNFHWTKR